MNFKSNCSKVLRDFFVVGFTQPALILNFKTTILTVTLQREIRKKKVEQVYQKPERHLSMYLHIPVISGNSVILIQCKELFSFIQTDSPLYTKMFSENTSHLKNQHKSTNREIRRNS